MNFNRKLTSAFAMFIALQALGWYAYLAPPVGAKSFIQSPQALNAIRFLVGPLGAILLFSAMLIAWPYPLTRERHARIRTLLRRRKLRESSSS